MTSSHITLGQYDVIDFPLASLLVSYYDVMDFPLASLRVTYYDVTVFSLVLLRFTVFIMALWIFLSHHFRLLTMTPWTCLSHPSRLHVVTSSHISLCYYDAMDFPLASLQVICYDVTLIIQGRCLRTYKIINCKYFNKY